MKSLRLLAGVAMVAALAGCASAPSHGVIHAKQANAAFYFTTYICSAYDKYGGCTLSVPMTNYSPPSWEFDLYASKDNHGWVYVDEATYEGYAVGSEYSVPRQ